MSKPVFTLRKCFSFEASHQLKGLPLGHQCARLHGHSYKVEIELKGTTLTDTGFLVDYGELWPFERFLKEQFDHRHLNDVLPEFGFDQPTAENLAMLFYNEAKKHWPEIVAVSVKETEKTWAEVRFE